MPRTEAIYFYELAPERRAKMALIVNCWNSFRVIVCV
jgi:hypothetical protein